jgi:hypothetical protein
MYISFKGSWTYSIQALIGLVKIFLLSFASLRSTEYMNEYIPQKNEQAISS